MPEEKEVKEEKEEIKETEQEAKKDTASEQDTAGDDTSSGVASGVLERAKAEFGIDEAEAKTLAASGALDKMFSAFDRGIMNTGRSVFADVEQKPKEKAKEPELEKKDEFPEISEDKFEPEIKKVAEYVKRHNQELEAVKSELARYKQREQVESVQSQQAFVNDFDSFLSGLGAKWEGVFGKGGSGALKEDSPEYKNRVKLADAMDVYMSGVRARGLQPPSQSELFRRALGAVFAEEFTKQGKQELSDKLKGRKSQHIARPTTKEGKPLTSKERAIKVAEDKAREYGLME